MATTKMVDSNRPQLLLLFVFSSLITHVLGQIQLVSAGSNGVSVTNGQSSGAGGEATSSSQPLWSYQAKPSNYISALPGGGHYGSGPSSSLFDAFQGLSQRQGALSGSPFLSILPIILIAAGGMLLLLPFLTMMMASPFGGAGAFGGGGYNGGFGYPQVGALSKKRSLLNAADMLPASSTRQDGQAKGLLDLFENFSSTIEELSRKYSSVGQQPKRAKVNSSPETPANNLAQQQRQHLSNHKIEPEPQASANAT